MSFFGAAFSGFALGLSLILAIGAQNAFVLRQGLHGRHVFAVALTCATSDALLIAAGVAGFGSLVAAAPWIVPVLTWGGAAFLFIYGARAFWAAWQGGTALDPVQDETSLKATLLTCLALTWLNPHVYLDTVALLGSIAASSSRPWVFGGGAIVASFSFFFSLAYGATFLRPLFSRPRTWQILEMGIGLVMWAIAVKLIVLL